MIVNIKNKKNNACINITINILIVIISDNILVIALVNLFSDNF